MSNIEFAQKIYEHGHHRPLPTAYWAECIEIIEPLVLAIVAIAIRGDGKEVAPGLLTRAESPMGSV
jgi:hypothetical protein